MLVNLLVNTCCPIDATYYIWKHFGRNVNLFQAWPTGGTLRVVKASVEFSFKTYILLFENIALCVLPHFHPSIRNLIGTFIVFQIFMVAISVISEIWSQSVQQRHFYFQLQK